VSNLLNWQPVTFKYNVFSVEVPLFAAKHWQSFKFREALHGTLVQEQMLVILGATILCVVAGNPFKMLY